MSKLVVRRLPWDFEGVDFVWNMDDPAFSITSNRISFFAVGFEKYICQAMSDAEKLITDPAVIEECRDFRNQESVHSMAHRKHVKALVARYPGLQAAQDCCVKMYDALYAAHDLKYHLAYVGGLESIFTPSFRLMLDNRETLFAGGDARVASLFLWHFCEEIEHRSSGIAVYDHVYGAYFYRVSRFREFMRHVMTVMKAIGEEFRRVFPEIPDEWFGGLSSHQLPRIDKLRSALGITMAQLPWHKPAGQALPEYFHEWIDRYERGEDMTRTYGVGAQTDLTKAA